MTGHDSVGLALRLRQPLEVRCQISMISPRATGSRVAMERGRVSCQYSRGHGKTKTRGAIHAWSVQVCITFRLSTTKVIHLLGNNWKHRQTISCLTGANLFHKKNYRTFNTLDYLLLLWSTLTATIKSRRPKGFAFSRRATWKEMSSERKREERNDAEKKCKAFVS